VPLNSYPTNMGLLNILFRLCLHHHLLEFCNLIVSTGFHETAPRPLLSPAKTLYGPTILWILLEGARSKGPNEAVGCKGRYCGWPQAEVGMTSRAIDFP
jgi:hypothetical protein